MKLFNGGISAKIDEKQKFKSLPRHIGIIMDGNGRWAQKRSLPRTAGHTVGAKTFRKIVKYLSHIGVGYTTVFAFSTENWRRPQDEVNALIVLFEKYLLEALQDFQNENIKINFLGDKSVFSAKIQNLMDETQSASKGKTGMVLNIAINYGARAEIAKAAKCMVQKVLSKELNVDEIDENVFSNFLYTSGQPDVDLIIRSGGEYRLSNFLLWQSAYAEYVASDVLWPDFKPEDIDRAIEEYLGRARRFGGVV